MTFRSLVQMTSVRVALAAAAVVTIACLISPLLAVHGVESAVVLGLLLPPFFAAMSARVAIGSRGSSLGAIARRVAAANGLVLAIPFVGLLLGAFRARWCAPLEGLGFFFLGPCLGIGLAAALGHVQARSWGRSTREARSKRDLCALGIGDH